MEHREETTTLISADKVSGTNVYNTVGDSLGETPVILQEKPEPGENIRVGDVVDLWLGKPGAFSDELTTDDKNEE